MRNVVIIGYLLLPLFTGSHIYSQNKEISSGHIVFEKKINLYGFFKNSPNQHLQMLAETYNPESGRQFITANYELYFDKNKSLYTPLPRETSPDMNITSMTMVGMDNRVFNDFIQKKTTTKKNIFGEDFLIKDVLRKIKWKLTNEKREIAGYSCRRANGLVMDSVYVVAFYTPDIAVKGGPESFNGLPGMILGVALPHNYTSWFATKIKPGNVGDKITTPKSGKEKTAAQLKELVTDLNKKYQLNDAWIEQAILL